MLPKINRLKKKKDFERVFKKGRSFKNQFLILKITQNNLNQNRFGFIVGQKISKKAVVRNRVKRRLREVVRLKMKKNYPLKSTKGGVPPLCKKRGQFKGVEKGIDGVLIALPGLENKNFLEIQEIVNNLFKKAGIT